MHLTISVFLKEIVEKTVYMFVNKSIDVERWLKHAKVNWITLRPLLPTPARQTSSIRTKGGQMVRTLYNAQSK